jgi:hypothetical protein
MRGLSLCKSIELGLFGGRYERMKIVEDPGLGMKLMLLTAVTDALSNTGHTMDGSATVQPFSVIGSNSPNMT